MKHKKHIEDHLVIVLRKDGIKLGTPNDNHIKQEDAMYFFAAFIEPIGNNTGKENSINFQFYSNELGDHGWIFGTYINNGELDFTYAGMKYDFMHIYPAKRADKYPAHLRAIPVTNK